MKTIINNKSELIVNKSRFIGLSYQINNIDSFNKILENVKKEYKDATHYCYAYIINNQEKYSDDKEPSNTAGSAILNILKKEKLNNVLCIVIRYFGGIKLGIGGLTRAYSNTCKQTLKIVNIEEKYLISITFDYNNIKEINYLIKNATILNKNFDDKVNYEIEINVTDFENIIDKLNKLATIEKYN